MNDEFMECIRRRPSFAGMEELCETQSANSVMTLSSADGNTFRDRLELRGRRKCKLQCDNDIARPKRYLSNHDIFDS